MSSIWMMDKSGIQPLILLQVLSIGYDFASTRTPTFSCRWSRNASILQLQHMETIGPRFIFLIWCESQTYCDFGYPNWSKHQLHEWYTSSFPTNTWFNQFIWGQRMPETKFWSGTITFVNWILVTECTAFHFLIIIWLIVAPQLFGLTDSISDISCYKNHWKVVDTQWILQQLTDYSKTDNPALHLWWCLTGWLYGLLDAIQILFSQHTGH